MTAEGQAVRTVSCWHIKFYAIIALSPKRIIAFLAQSWAASAYTKQDLFTKMMGQEITIYSICPCKVIFGVVVDRPALKSLLNEPLHVFCDTRTICKLRAGIVALIVLLLAQTAQQSPMRFVCCILTFSTLLRCFSIPF